LEKVKHNQGETYGFPFNPIPYLFKTGYSKRDIQNGIFKTGYSKRDIQNGIFKTKRDGVIGETVGLP
jgi:hypothetical protein